MAIENFTTYTETDPNDYLTVVSNKITYTNDTRLASSSVKKDFGEDYFDKDFEHLMTMYHTYTDLEASISRYSLVSSDGTESLKINIYTHTTYSNNNDTSLREYYNGTAATVHTESYLLDTIYYVRVWRDGSVGTYGTIYADFYTSKTDRTNKINMSFRMTSTLHTRAKYRYVVMTEQVYSSGNSKRSNGWISDLELKAPSNVANVKINHTKVDADLTDYPVYINLADMPDSFWNTVSNGGGDIRVYKSDGTTQLAREVVSCNKGLINSTHSTDLEKDSTQSWSITNANQTGLNITGDLTLECWVKNESNTSDGETRVILSRYKTSTADRSFRLGYYNNGGTPQIGFATCADGQSAIYRRKNKTLTVGQWFHIAITYDASAGSATFYVNGESIGTETGFHNSLYGGTADFMVGAMEAGNSWDGAIDDVRVWDDIRTAAEIKDNYFKELNGNEDNLQGYWKFNNNADDSTSNGNDLTNNNSATFTTDVPERTGELHVKYTGTLSSTADTTIQIWADGTSSEPTASSTYGSEAVWSDYEAVWHMADANDSTVNGYDGTVSGATSGATGKLGGAYTFNGGSDQINCGDVDITGELTMSSWFKTTDYTARQQIFFKGSGTTSGLNYSYGIRSSSNYWENYDSGWGVDYASTTLTNDDWYYGVAVVKSDTTQSFYLDGSPDGDLVSTTLLANNYDLLIGRWTGATDRTFKGDLCELRLSSSNFSATWISTEYNNQNSPSTFYSASEPTPPTTNSTNFFMMFG